MQTTMGKFRGALKCHWATGIDGNFDDPKKLWLKFDSDWDN